VVLLLVHDLDKVLKSLLPSNFCGLLVLLKRHDVLEKPRKVEVAVRSAEREQIDSNVLLGHVPCTLDCTAYVLWRIGVWVIIISKQEDLPLRHSIGLTASREDIVAKP
jgi:hypothetical protein